MYVQCSKKRLQRSLKFPVLNSCINLNIGGFFCFLFYIIIGLFLDNFTSNSVCTIQTNIKWYSSSIPFPQEIHLFALIVLQYFPVSMAKWCDFTEI